MLSFCYDPVHAGGIIDSLPRNRETPMQSNPYESPETAFGKSMNPNVATSPANPSHNGRDMAIASLIMAATLIVASPLALILAVQVWKFADQSPNVVLLHAWLARFGCSAIMIVSVVSLWTGLASIRRAKIEGAARTLPNAGEFLSLVALCLWIVTTIGVLNTTESLLRLYG